MASIVSLVLTLPICLLFMVAGAGKLRKQRLFRYTLINLGLPRLATRATVRSLGLVEVLGGLTGMLFVPVGAIAAVPMLVALCAFTLVLVLRRPSSCGCGLLDTTWGWASARNSSLIAILVIALQFNA
ncbi:MAG: MauE/DoxX family redox-associated membrane protein [Dehalococcoidia bacterium]